MERFLKPERFESATNSPDASKEWTHWIRTFENFVSSFDDVTEESKLQLLINHVSFSVFQLISECKTYQDALVLLESLYVRPKNEVYARHVLSTKKQGIEESIDQYVQELNLLSKNCNFKDVTAVENRDDYIRDSFISGLRSSEIRCRLLENATLTLESAINQARALETAQKHSASYLSTDLVPSLNSVSTTEDSSTSILAAQTSKRNRCYFCGATFHPRRLCPAKDSTCLSCGKLGHYSKVCRSKSGNSNKPTEILAASPNCLRKSVVRVTLNGQPADALIDTGSSESFINENFVHTLKLKINPHRGIIAMASTNLNATTVGYCHVDLEISNYKHTNIKLSIIRDLCADLVIGHDVLGKHSKVVVNFGGSQELLNVCCLAVARIKPPRLFKNLTANCKPIATKSRRYSSDDLRFISDEVKKLLQEGIIEESNSPWRAQALVTKSETHKKRLVIDYSQTINLYTQLDAYPLPRIEDIVYKVSQFRVFSTIDLRSAYHQIPLPPEDKIYTGFEAAGKLYQFNRIPFGVTNGVAGFQRVIDNIISEEKLVGVYAYLDDVTICGRTQSEHDLHLDKFMEAVNKYGLTLNKEKSCFSLRQIKLLGYLIEDGIVKPDPSRLKPLLALRPPTNASSLKQVLGLFAHYAKWIPRFSEKVNRLNSRNFPLPSEAISAFQELKDSIVKSAVSAIEENEPFTVETDASESAIAATLSQSGRPVAFFSRTLSKSEKRYSSVEKEAQAIYESLLKWRHFLIGRHFKLVTDQRSVSFMFNMKLRSKIKNEKVLRWRLELSSFKFDIIYRPGTQNAAADALSRCCGAVTNSSLRDLHNMLSHPGITRMMHWVRNRNLPFSIEDVRKMTASCSICAELKPRFLKNFNHKLIKSTSAFERLNMDFKGPLPSETRNKYLLTIVDEYSRFPFAFPCSDMSSATVIKHLNQLFSIFGMPAFIHSDRGTCFMSSELKQFLQNRNIATSHSTPYNPEGNGQIERYNGIIWKTITLALKTKNLKISQWERVMDEALYSIRSLLCTATNCTPHERMFVHSRRTVTGTTTPTWLTPGPVFLKKFVRLSKYDPLVEQVQLVEANPSYARVRFSDGRESTVSLKHLAPVCENDAVESHSENVSAIDQPLAEPRPIRSVDVTATEQSTAESRPIRSEDVTTTERSLAESRPTRIRKPPRHLEDYECNF